MRTYFKAVVVYLIVFYGCVLYAQSAERPNVVVVFTDDHGWADLGVHEILDDIQTPHIDALARDGVLFRSGYITAPQCIPSRAGIISGAYQQSFGVDDNRFSPMPAETLTVPERLQQAGYTTGMVGKWHLDPNVASEEWLREHSYKGRTLPPRNERRIPHADKLPYKTGRQGFDEFFEGYIYNYWANFDLTGASLEPSGEYLKTEERDRLDIQTDAALAFIRRNHRDPFFLYLAYFAPHVPLESTEKYLSRFPPAADDPMPERRRYALAMISAVDDGVGRIREQLRQYGELDNTLIFFIGDNGAPLKLTMEDIPLTFKGGAWDGSMNTPLNGEKGMLSEGGIRVPYVMSWPDRVSPGQVSDIPVSSLDVGATAVELAGLEPDAALAGENILELMQAPKKAAERPLFWRFWGQAALRLGDWKYLRAGDHEFLFDLSKDISEQNNLRASHPEKLASMRALWVDWNAGLQRPYQGESGELNDQEQRFYNFYFDVDTGASKQPAHPPAFMEWEARHAERMTDGKGLYLGNFEARASRCFITVNRLGLGLEAILRIQLTSDQAGSGQVQIRYRGEPRFQSDNDVAFDYQKGENSLSIALPIEPGQTLEHLRLILPFKEHTLRIRSMTLFSDGSVLKRWDY